MRLLVQSACALLLVSALAVQAEDKDVMKEALVDEKDAVRKGETPTEKMMAEEAVPATMTTKRVKTVAEGLALGRQPLSKEAELNVELESKPARQSFAENVVTLGSFTTLLHTNPGEIHPEILKDYNLTAEMEHWKTTDLPPYLPFQGDDGEIVHATVGGLHQPVTYNLLGSPADFVYRKSVKFHFFNKDDEKDLRGFQFTNINAAKDLKEHGWDENLPVKVVIHGFLNNIESPAIQLIKNALLKTGKYNVIGVDWGKLVNLVQYDVATMHVFGTGARVGLILDDLVKAGMTEPAKIHIIGHSLGAHVSGIAAKSMKTGQPDRVTGLDPAGPLFWLAGPKSKIWRTDAKLVDIIHTDAGFFGKSEALGHVDFHPNGGKWQLGCTETWVLRHTCAHSRAVELFADSILKNEGLLGISCDAVPASDGRQCLARSAQNEKIYEARMGYNLSFEKPGTYYTFT